MTLPKPFFHDENCTIYHASAYEIILDLDATFDTVLTDPPYGIGINDSKWDYDIPGLRFWRDLCRMAKPGAMLMAFGATRTFHRLACEIEDAGWEIRDHLVYLFSGGFPKSLDISKAIDKTLGVLREKVKTPVKDMGRKFVSSRPWMQRAVEKGYHEHDSDVPASVDAERWQGWKSVLRPAWEPIIVAMKHLHGSYADNALRYGVAGFNVDGSRIESEERPDKVPAPMTEDAAPITLARSGFMGGSRTIGTTTRGRWPSNVLLDGDAADMLDQQHPGASRFFYCVKTSNVRDPGNTHPTVKPLGLMRYLCSLTKTPTGGTILDPFAGSGSTLVAALQSGRKAVGIEIDRKSCEMAAERVVNCLRKIRA